jgi:hypothetical protein
MSDLGLFPIIHVESRASMPFDQRVIGFGIFFRDDLRRREIFLQIRALDLSRLLRERALGHQNQAMPRRKILQRLRNIGKNSIG